MRVIIFLFLIVSLKGAEMDLSDVPCKHFLEGPSKDVANANEYTEPSNIDDYKYGTNGKICNIFQSSTSEEHDPGSTSAEVGLVSLRKNFFSHCGKFGFTKNNEFKLHRVPLKDSGKDAIATSGAQGISNALPFPFEPAKPGLQPTYTPEKEYQITVKSDIVGGVSRRLYASAGEILSSSGGESSGGKSGQCFNANEITTEDVTFTWKAPKSGAGKVYFQSIVGSANANLLLLKDSCTKIMKDSSQIGCASTPGNDCCNNIDRTNSQDSDLPACQGCESEYDPCWSTCKSVICCATNAPSNFTTANPQFVFVSGERIEIDEGFVSKTSKPFGGVDPGLLGGVIGGSVGFLITIAIIYALCRKKNVETGDEGEEEDEEEGNEKNFEMPNIGVQQAIPNTANTVTKRRRGKKRSWIQRVARRANEFGRQVPENIQIESEIYDDYIDTYMTVILWILLVGILLFTIVDEYTNPTNMSVAFCSDNRESYCNGYKTYSELGNCGGEAGNAIGQADKSERTSMCGLRSDGDHLLSILTNYGALSGLVTALCRYIANTWKGCKRKKRNTVTGVGVI